MDNYLATGVSNKLNLPVAGTEFELRANILGTKIIITKEREEKKNKTRNKEFKPN